MTNAMANPQRAQKIEQFFDQLNLQTMHLVEQIYAPDARFEDPIGEQQGVDAIRSYYENMYKGAATVRFEYQKQVIEGNRHVLPWTMTYRGKRFKKHKDIVVTGISLIEFLPNEDKIIYHRDYFDMGELIYEELPVFSWLIKRIHKRLHNEPKNS